MTVDPIPEGFHTVTPYLVVRGVDRLLAFLKEGFHAEETEKLVRADGSVLHAEVRIGDSMLMLGEAQPDANICPAAFYLYVEDTDATYAGAIGAGASSEREPEDTYYGNREAGVRDDFGNTWWIATHMENVTAEEIERRAAEATGG